MPGDQSRRLNSSIWLEISDFHKFRVQWSLEIPMLVKIDLLVAEEKKPTIKIQDRISQSKSDNRIFWTPQDIFDIQMSTRPSYSLCSQRLVFNGHSRWDRNAMPGKFWMFWVVEAWSTIIDKKDCQPWIGRERLKDHQWTNQRCPGPSATRGSKGQHC